MTATILCLARDRITRENLNRMIDASYRWEAIGRSRLAELHRILNEHEVDAPASEELKSARELLEEANDISEQLITQVAFLGRELEDRQIEDMTEESRRLLDRYMAAEPSLETAVLAWRLRLKEILVEAAVPDAYEPILAAMKATDARVIAISQLERTA